MSNPMQQLQSQAPPQVPAVYYPQPAADQTPYPYMHNVYFGSPPISSSPTPQSLPPQASQSQAPMMYNMAVGSQHMPQYMPPANKNMLSNNHGPVPFQGMPAVPANYQAPSQFVTGGPAPQTVPANVNWNPTPSSGPQMPHHVPNNTNFPGYLPTTPSPAGHQIPGQVVNTNHLAQPAPRNMSSGRPQTPRTVTNSNPSNQHVATSAPAGAHPGQYHASPTTQPVHRKMQQPVMHPMPQPTPPPRGNAQPGARRPSQPSPSNGHGVVQNYAQIIHGHLLPQDARPGGQHGGGPRPQSSDSQPNFTNGGHSPQFPNPANATYQSPRQAKPVPQPMAPATRYNLPTNAPVAPPQSVQRRTATPPVVSNGNMPQGGSVSPRSSVPPPSNMPPPNSVPTRASMPPAAQQQPVMNTGTKRAAAQALPQQSTKRQRKPASASAVQQHPTTSGQQSAGVAPAQQAPPASDNATLATYSPVAPLAPSFVPEPMHLPDWELAKINTSYVVEPDITKPRPEGKTAVAWEQIINMVVELIRQHCKKGQLLRPGPREHLHELSDALEEFIARPGRNRELVPSEAQDLLNVRYVRVIEDGIWEGMFARIPDRDHDSYVSTVPEDKERVVREAWEKRHREYQGPSLEEAQRQIFKWDIPGFGNVPARAESEPEEDSEPRPPKPKPKPWWMEGL